VKVDNSQIVREQDPRSLRELLFMLALVAVLVAGLVLYAWPHLQVRQTGMASERLNRERERLLEQGRKRRVEAIATRDLGMRPPPTERLIVVERSEGAQDAARVARSEIAPQPAPTQAPAGRR